MFIRSIPVALLALVLTATAAVAESGPDAISLSAVAHIHGIGFDPKDAGRILLATHFGVYRTNSDGTASQLSQFDNDFMGFSPAADGSGRLYASGHPSLGGNLGVIASEDGGVSWTMLSEGVGGPVDFHAMAVSKANPNVLYGIFRGLQVSRDGGRSWSMLAPAPDGIIDLAAGSDAEGHLYAGTTSGLLESTDAGASWASTGPAGGAVTMVETGADGAAYAFVAATGLFRRASDDGQWVLVSDAFSDGDILHLAIDPTNPLRLVASTQASQVIKSPDGGATW